MTGGPGEPADLAESTEPSGSAELADRPPRPRILTIAGSDSGGGAGVQADLKTFQALGAHGMSALTLITAQNSLGVHGTWLLPPEAISAQFEACVTDLGVDAVKTGALGDADRVRLVAELLGTLDDQVPVVVDPVALSKHGDTLLSDDAREAVLRDLLPRTTVFTPNLDEAHWLLGHPVPDRTAMRAAARELRAHGPRWILLKGGHLAADDAADLLTDGESEHWFVAERIPNRHTHGTGCTYASATAAHLGAGLPVPEAVARAKRYVTAAIARGYPLGAGIGPVGHPISPAGSSLSRSAPGSDANPPRTT